MYAYTIKWYLKLILNDIVYYGRRSWNWIMFITWWGIEIERERVRQEHLWAIKFALNSNIHEVQICTCLFINCYAHECDVYYCVYEPFEYEVAAGELEIWMRTCSFNCNCGSAWQCSRLRARALLFPFCLRLKASGYAESVLFRYVVPVFQWFPLSIGQ